MDNNSAYYPASDQLEEDDYARSGPQSVSLSGNDNKVLPTSKYLSHSLSLPNVVDGPSLEQQHHYNPQQFQSQPHYQQQQYQHYQRAHSSVADISNMSSVGSIFNNLSLDQPASTESRVYHQPLTGSREAFTEPTVKRGLHRTSQGGGGGLNTDSFARSCPQTEMERLKSRYLREKSNSLSHNSSHSSIDLTGLQPLETLQDVKSYDSDEDYDVVSPFNDFSIDYFSPNGSRVSQGGFLDSPVRRGLQRTNSHGSNCGFYPYTFARSCPQTEMERLKAEYLKEKTSYQSHNSSHSSIDVGGLQQQQPMRQSQSQLQSHQSSSSYQHQNIRRYDSDEDDDVLLLNFNSPLTDMSLENMSPKDSRVIQPPISSNRDNFTDPSLRRGMPRTSSHGGGGFIPETFARSCPQTEMERLKAHYMKERLSGSSVDNQAFNHKKMLQHSNSYSSRSAFPVPPSGTGTDYHNSSLLGLSNRDAHSLNYRGNSSHMHDRNDNFSDQKFGNRKYSSPIPKEKNQVNHNRDNREFSNNDLGVFTFDSGGTFSDKVSASQRENVFNCIKASKAQIILLSNTALKTEDQLQVVRAEVKTFFPCESAMWASFSSDELPDEAQSGELSQDSNNVTGRGVIILVLGPLAPRTGWIKSDSTGCVISASARIKPNLPVLTFTACDFGGALADKRMDHSSLDFLRDLVETEYEKDNIIIMGGNLSGDIGKPPTESSCCMTTPISGWIESRCVNVSIVCNSSTPTKKSGCFSEDVVVCQKKKSMTILGVDVTDSFSSNDCAATLPVLVKLSISGWPKKSYAVQVKAKQIAKSDAPSFPEKSQWSNKVDSNIRGTSQSQLNTRSKLMSDLLNWQKNLQDFSHNLQGILHASIDKSVRFKCLQQLLTDILNRGHSDSERLDTPGFANTIYLSHLSSLLALPEDDFLAKSTDIEQVIGSWHSAVSLSISSADALP